MAVISQLVYIAFPGGLRVYSALMRLRSETSSIAISWAVGIVDRRNRTLGRSLEHVLAGLNSRMRSVMLRVDQPSTITPSVCSQGVLDVRQLQGWLVQSFA
jgi:hypothetical protein